MTREALLVRTLVEMADNLVDDFDVIDVLTVLSDRCVEVLDVDSAGVMLVAPGGELQVVASSSAAMRGLELFELQANEGPCVDCFVSGRPVVNRELRRGGRPVAALRPTGRRRRLPLRVRTPDAPAHHPRWAPSTCSGPRPSRSPGDDLLVAQALADVATIAIIQHQTSVDAAVLNTQLTEALEQPHHHRAGQGQDQRGLRPGHGPVVRPPAQPRPEPQPAPDRAGPWRSPRGPPRSSAWTRSPGSGRPGRPVRHRTPPAGRHRPEAGLGASTPDRTGAAARTAEHGPTGPLAPQPPAPGRHRTVAPDPR